MELRAFWSVLMRWRWVVVLVTAAAIVGSGALALISPPGYKAITMVTFSAPVASTPTSIPGLDEQNRLLSAEQVVDDFTKIVPTYGFAQGVAKRLSPPPDPLQIEKVWTVKKQAHHLLTIEAGAATDAQAVALAKAAADEISANGQQYYADLNSSDLKVAIADPAHSEGLSGRLLDYLFIVARIVVGLIVGIGLAFLCNYMDDRIRGTDDAEALGLRVIGAIPIASGKLLANGSAPTTSMISRVGT